MNFVKHNNKQIEKIQRRALSVVHEKYDSNLYQLLALSKTASFHIKFIHKILEEIYKTLKKQNPPFLAELFVTKTSGYELRRGEQLMLPPANTVRFGLHSLSFVGSLVWDRSLKM